MDINIKLKKGQGKPDILQYGEPAFDKENKTLYIGDENKEVIEVGLSEADREKLKKSTGFIYYENGEEKGEISNNYETNVASGYYSHAEGNSTKAKGNESHAEGIMTIAEGAGSHAEGSGTKAEGIGSHAEGSNTVASGFFSHSEGKGTISAGDYQYVGGTYNIADTDGKYAHIVGNGTSDADRRNAYTLDWDGNAWFAGKVLIGGTNQDDAKELASKETTLKGYGITDAYTKQETDEKVSNIITVTELPTENIDEDKFYLLLSGNVVFYGTEIPDSKVYCVASLPNEGEPVSNLQFTALNMYYNLSDNEPYGYINDELSAATGLSTGWNHINLILQLVNAQCGGIIFNIEDSYTELENTLYLFLNYTLWEFKNKWIPLTNIGKYGEGFQSEIFNSVKNIASGNYSHAEGYYTTASGDMSHAEGYETKTGEYDENGNYIIDTGNYAHAEGYSTLASGHSSHAEGNNTTATGSDSHAEGYGTIASGSDSHTEGFGTKALGSDSHAEGTNTEASGNSSHAEGYRTKTGKYDENGNYITGTGNYSHAEGSLTEASGDNSHAEGNNTTASGDSSHAEGYSTTVSKDYSHAEGGHTTASGYYSHAEGFGTEASGDKSHAEGYSTNKASDYIYDENNNLKENNSIIIEWNTNKFSLAKGDSSHVEGKDNLALGLSSHAEGNNTTASGNYSHAEGHDTVAEGGYSHAEGHDTTALGDYSHAEGYNTEASKNNSHAEGYNTAASGEGSHAEGRDTIASGNNSHAEGLSTLSRGYESHAEGFSTEALGKYSHAEGWSTIASGESSHTEGSSTNKASDYIYNEDGTIKDNSSIISEWNTNKFSLAIGDSAHVEGKDNLASGEYSHAEGHRTVASGNSSHAEGYSTEATGKYSHAEGWGTDALGENSHAEGYKTIASRYDSHAEGHMSTASGDSSHAEGHSTTASGENSHAEGHSTEATGKYSHAEGNSTNKACNYIYDEDNNLKDNDAIINEWNINKFSLAKGDSAHVEGKDNLALGNRSHAEGINTFALGIGSHAEGCETKTGKFDEFDNYITGTGTYAHAEGYMSRASGNNSHAEGDVSHAEGESSHAEGYSTIASGYCSHAEGFMTIANGENSHAEGSETVASGTNQHVEGQFNEEDTENRYAHIVGNGTDDDNRSNAHTLDWDGNAWFAGNVLVGGNSQDDGTVLAKVNEPALTDFFDYSDLTPINTYEFNVSSTSYFNILTRPNPSGLTPIEVNDRAKFRITTYNDDYTIFQILDIMLVFPNAPSAPQAFIHARTVSSTTSITGLYTFSVIYPKVLGNEYDWVLSAKPYNNTLRHVKIEVFETSDKLTWYPEYTIQTALNSTYQTQETSNIGGNRGLCMLRSQQFAVSSASSAAYLSSYLTKQVGTGSYTAGEKLNTYTIGFYTKERKIYSFGNTEQPIDVTNGVVLVGTSQAQNASINYNILRIFAYGALSTFKTSNSEYGTIPDTIVAGTKLYLKCELREDGNIYSTGEITDEMYPGYTWWYLGEVTNPTYFNINMINSQFITLDTSSMISHINGIKIISDKLDLIEDSSNTNKTFVFSENAGESIYCDEALTSLNLSITDSINRGYVSELSFDSGEIATLINYNSDIVINWRGVDCAETDTGTEFVPLSNKHYDILFTHNGQMLIGYVDGYSTTKEYLITSAIPMSLNNEEEIPNDTDEIEEEV